MALGLLSIPIRDFERMTIKQVYYRLKGLRDARLHEEVVQRRQIYYTVAPYWSGKMPLQYMWQIWHIPEVDGPIEQAVRYSKVRLVTPEEKRLLKERPPGWENQLLEIQRKIREDAG